MTVNAPCAGTILSISAVPGQVVDVGTELLIVESMKMEIHVEAPAAGTIEKVLAAVGATIAEGDPLVLMV